MLYIVATSIGNLQDMTFRAIDTLKQVDLILAEDTRTSKKLLQHYQIDTPLKSFHAHNEHAQLEHVISRLKGGENMALISDAGTPGISDPGFLIVRKCVEENIELTCLPGAVALVPALVMSGIPCDRFYFEGFLPQKKGKKTRIEFLLNLNETFVLYESPFRILKTLKQIDEFSDVERKVSVSREISKIYEENIRGSVKEVIGKLEKLQSIKGEIVLTVSGKPKK